MKECPICNTQYPKNDVFCTTCVIKSNQYVQNNYINTLITDV